MVAIDQPKIIKICLAIIIAFSFGLCVSSFASARQCYVKPCFQGDGLDMLWAVDGGQSFQVVCVALISIAHGFVAFVVLFRSTYDELKYGMLVSATAVLALVLLTQSVYWGQQAALVQALKSNAGDTNLYYERNVDCDQGNNQTVCDTIKHCAWTSFGACQRAMAVDNRAKQKFDAVTAFSVLLAVVHALFTYLLISWKDEFGNVFGAPRISTRASAFAASTSGPVSHDTFKSTVPVPQNFSTQTFDANSSYQTAEDDRL